MEISSPACNIASASSGGRDGSDLSSFMPGLLCFFELMPRFFFLRRCIKDSWQSMQKIPCDVRAYRKFSIFLLQFRHRKHWAQNACSPVRIARSSILFPQELQLYVQLLQINDPSPSRRRCASESRRVLHELQRKQSICHRFPAKKGKENVGQQLGCVNELAS
ncbi:hypothetical protein BJX63DRAFT_211516 [Aspergillus granulosus]|uniref:Uncharacterized protein n=1 Tax=Aspergillus granulosus TaxID=176169 RepID=A0ABR4HEF4_9EURO